MIKNLKRKFILITMTFITIILVVIFSVLCFNTYNRLDNEVKVALNFALQRAEQPPIFDFKDKDSFKRDEFRSNINSFTFVTDESNQVISVFAGNYQIDVVTAQSLIDATENNDSGILSNLSFIYQRQKTNTGYTYAFVDITSPKQALISFLITSLIIGLLAFAAFLVLTFLLADWALKPVVQSWTQQKQFLADASHELKTPLTVILAHTDLTLAKKQTDPDQKQSLESIKSEALRMKKLVEDLLFLARNDANKIEPKVSMCPISEIALGCILSMETIAYEKGIELESDIDDQLMIYSDENQFKQLIMIFLDNAIKYTPSNHKIFFSLKKKDQHIQMKIRNEGSYIDKEDINHIFDRFYRCDKSRAFQGGYGLGLSIAKQIMDSLKFSVKVSSTKNEGTCFTITL